MFCRSLFSFQFFERLSLVDFAKNLSSFLGVLLYLLSIGVLFSLITGVNPVVDILSGAAAYWLISRDIWRLFYTKLLLLVFSNIAYLVFGSAQYMLNSVFVASDTYGNFLSLEGDGNFSSLVGLYYGLLMFIIISPVFMELFLIS